MYLSAETAAATTSTIAWPTVILILGLALVAIMLLISIVAFVQEHRKTTIVAGQEDALRQLVNRYEQLAASTLDAQQRVAADVAELRSRTSSIEQILRTVD